MRYITKIIVFGYVTYCNYAILSTFQYEFLFAIHRKVDQIALHGQNLALHNQNLRYMVKIRGYIIKICVTWSKSGVFIYFSMYRNSYWKVDKIRICILSSHYVLYFKTTVTIQSTDQRSSLPSTYWHNFLFLAHKSLFPMYTMTIKIILARIAIFLIHSIVEQLKSFYLGNAWIISTFQESRSL